MGFIHSQAIADQHSRTHTQRYIHIKIHRHTQTYHQVVVEICKEVWRSAAGPQTVRQRFEVPYQEGVVDSNVVVNSQVVVDIYHSVFLLWPSRIIVIKRRRVKDGEGKEKGVSEKIFFDIQIAIKIGVAELSSKIVKVRGADASVCTFLVSWICGDLIPMFTHTGTNEYRGVDARCFIMAMLLLRVASISLVLLPLGVRSLSILSRSKEDTTQISVVRTGLKLGHAHEKKSYRDFVYRIISCAMCIMKAAARRNNITGRSIRSWACHLLLLYSRPGCPAAVLAISRKGT